MSSPKHVKMKQLVIDRLNNLEESIRLNNERIQDLETAKIECLKLLQQQGKERRSLLESMDMLFPKGWRPEHG